MKSILLTIAVPTYNGEATLLKTLESICSQIGPGVDVLVSDNCSSDATGRISRSFCEKFPAVRYVRQDINVGYDRNVDFCVRNAAGGFVWLVGDDDVLLPGAVADVAAALGSNPEVGMLFANYPHQIEVSGNDGGICNPGGEFLAKTKFKSGFMSANVFQKGLWLKTDVSRYFDSGWIHMGFVIEAAMSAPAYIVPRHCVDYIRDGSALMRWGGGGSFIQTGLKLVEIYRRMPALGYSGELSRRAALSVKGGYWKNICIAKAKGFAVNPALLAQFVRLYRGFFSFWLVDLPLLLCPGILFRGLYRIYRIYRGLASVR